MQLYHDKSFKITSQSYCICFTKLRRNSIPLAPKAVISTEHPLMADGPFLPPTVVMERGIV